jgi:hypothetical protein
MLKIVKALAVASLIGVLAACGSQARGGSAPTPKTPATEIQLPAKTIGHGKDGSISTLTISQHGDSFTGVYLVTLRGMPANTALRYNVEGTASNGKLDSTWTLGSVSIHVTGHYTAERITLDNPGGSFSTTVFIVDHSTG